MSHVTTDCITCGTVICLAPARDKWLRKSGETFYCSNGHRQSYIVGKTAEEKKIEQLEGSRDRFRTMWHETLEREHDLKIEVRTCPFGCGFRVKRKQLIESVRAAMVMHLVEEHDADLVLEGELVTGEEQKALSPPAR